MATRSRTLFLLLAAAVLSAAVATDELGWIVDPAEEFALGSEFSRRILTNAGYISYDALRRDSTPCSRRGASYYNCRPGAAANPYTRGCSAITRCRS